MRAQSFNKLIGVDQEEVRYVQDRVCKSYILSVALDLGLLKDRK